MPVTLNLQPAALAGQPGTVKQIIKGKVAPSYTGAYYDVTIPAVDVSKSAVAIEGAGITNVSYPENAFGELTSSTNLRIHRMMTVTAAGNLGYQVTENY